MINLKYNLISRNLNSKTILKISNLVGQTVRVESWNTIMGDNTHSINLLDDDNNSLPLGVYYYEINIESQLWTEPKKGMFVITR
ncbi:MAG: hypothetical protein A2X64_10660 [Ignavibacteria bacterium GWF2_33_9]|nr:MAG: hypothetical protein A2X64_10660 [Ignavibacteria bacterium GWF2_33_9]